MNFKAKTSSTFDQQNKLQNYKNCQILDQQTLKIDLEQSNNPRQSEFLLIFQSECKKIMKSYFKCLKRNKSFDYKKIFSQMIYCLSKIFSNSKNDNYDEATSGSLTLCIEKSHQKHPNNNFLIFQLKQKQESKFLQVLSRVISMKSTQQMMAMIEILSLDRKIVYTKIGPYNEQFLSQVLSTTSSKFNIVLTFNDNFIDRETPFEELQKLHEKSISTDSLSQHQIQLYLDKNQTNMQDNSIIKTIQNTIKQFKLEKRFIFDFFQRKGDRQSFIQTETQAHMFTLYFNIKSLIVNLSQKYKHLACQAFQHTISKSLLKYTDPKYEESSTSRVSNTHYPLKLKNAMLCQNCCRKRTYLYCQQCTNLQDKIISLCLHCYKVFHLNKPLQLEAIGTKQQFIKVQTWKKMDLEIQADLNNSFLQLFGTNYFV